jgi:formate hydrogenlyase subunit 6/NADH:ubiquinone oxidoreductase subunit I
MTLLKFRTLIRRLGRLALLVLLGYPYVIVLLPLSIWLGIHMIGGWLNLEHDHGWSGSELMRCVGLTIGAVLLMALVLVYLAATVYVGWKGHADLYRRGSWASISRPWLHAVITRENLLARIDALAGTHRLVGPVLRAEPRCEPPRRYFYETVKQASALALDFDYCVFAPKAALLPPRETLFRFDASRRRFEATVADEDGGPTALVGVHPCDLHAIRLLDEVFARDHCDEHYGRRRQGRFIVGMDCGEPCTPGVFCGETNTHHAREGFDVMLYPLGADGDSANEPRRADAFGIVYGTEAGQDWLAVDDGAAVRQPSIEDKRRFERYLMHKKTAFPRRLAQPWSDIPTTLAGSYDSLVWEATAQRCYSCGSCNLACPTCYCFDIQDCNDLPPQRGRRERTWDGCMLRDFAVVAGGHNFRSERAQRLRHRIFRKGAWIEQRTGLSGCVGCGRCDRACTAHISIVEILNRLTEERDGGQRARGAPAAAAAGD